MGRRPKPLEFHVIEGKKHLTKEEKAERANSKIAIGDSELEEPAFVSTDKVAHKKWMECKKIYEANRDFNLVSSADSGFLGKYCRTFSEYISLLEIRYNLSTEAHFDILRKEMLLIAEDEFVKKLYKKIEYLTTLEGLLVIDAAINKKLSSLTQMEDRLFLNPQSRIRTALPKSKQQKPKDKIEAAGFDL